MDRYRDDGYNFLITLFVGIGVGMVGMALIFYVIGK